MFAYHFGWTPDEVDSLTYQDFMILVGWLDRHEKKEPDEE